MQVDVDGNPTVGDLINDIIEELADIGEEDDVFGEPADLYLSTIGGRRLPKGAKVKDLLASGTHVVLHRRLRGGMQVESVTEDFKNRAYF